MSFINPKFTEPIMGATKNNSSIYSVLFGTDGILTENELNEIQWLNIQKLAEITRTIYKSGVVEDFTLTADTVNKKIQINMVNGQPLPIVVDGYFLKIGGKLTSNAIQIDYSGTNFGNGNNIVFLEIWFSEINGNASNNINVFGGPDNTHQMQYEIRDDRFGQETTRRIQLRWKISVAKDKSDFNNISSSITNQTYSQNGTDSCYISYKDENKNLLETSYAIPIFLFNKQIESINSVFLKKSINKSIALSEESGLILDEDGLNIDLTTNSGLEKTSDGLKIDLSSNSGLIIDTNGIKVDFGTGENQAPRGNHSHNIQDLSNVLINSPTENQVIAYDESDQKWKNKPLTGVSVQKVNNISPVSGNVSLSAVDVGATPSTHVGSGGSEHAVVTTTTNGFMIASDKVKLNGIADNANNYVHPNEDGHKHLPNTIEPGTGNTQINHEGKFLKAGLTAGVTSWQNITSSDISDIGTLATTNIGTENVDKGLKINGGKLQLNLAETSPGLIIETTGLSLDMGAVRNRGEDSISSGSFANTEGKKNLAAIDSSHAEGFSTFSVAGKIYEIFNISSSGTQSIITLNSIENLSSGDSICVKIINNKPLITNIQSVNIGTSQITINYSYDPFSSPATDWKYIVKINNTNIVASHSEGANTLSSGYASHAEGNQSIATNNSAHAEGYLTKATGQYSHAEGQQTEANGNSSHAEGYGTIAENSNSHAEGFKTFSGQGIYINNDDTIVSINNNKIETNGNGIGLIATDKIFIMLNNGTMISALVVSISQEFSGMIVTKTDYTINTFGYSGTGLSQISKANLKSIIDIVPNLVEASNHAEGIKTISCGIASHAEGNETRASGSNSHAEGYRTVASNNNCHAEGADTRATGVSAHAEGTLSEANGDWSHAGGYHSIANGDYQTVIGKFNQSDTISRFIIGDGTSDTRKNVFRVDGTTGTPTTSINASGAGANVHALVGYSVGTHADYAEMFEWADGNENNEDRRGHFVTLGNDDKVRVANENDEYILGIVSTTPAIIGDSAHLEWSKKYVRNEWGQFIYEEVTIPAKYSVITHPQIYKEETILGDNGEYVVEKTIIQEAYEEQLLVENERTEYQPKVNEEYDETAEYIPRSNRKEWATIGMLGKIYVRDDGTCQVGGYCKPNQDGIATDSLTGYRVIKRINENIVRVIFR